MDVVGAVVAVVVAVVAVAVIGGRRSSGSLPPSQASGVWSVQAAEKCTRYFLDGLDAILIKLNGAFEVFALCSGTVFTQEVIKDAVFASLEPVSHYGERVGLRWAGSL